MSKPNIDTIITTIKSDDAIPSDKKSEIIKQLESAKTPLDTDPWIYRMVVFFLGFAVLSTVIGGIILTYVGGTSANYQIPQGIVAIGSAAVGALAGLLAPSPKQQS